MALHDVVKSVKVRYIDASSMYAWQFTKALYLADLHGRTRFVSIQNLYNLLYREEEPEMISLCESEGIGVLPGALWRVAASLVRGKVNTPNATKRTSSGRASTRRAKKLTVKLWTAWVSSQNNGA